MSQRRLVSVPFTRFTEMRKAAGLTNSAVAVILNVNQFEPVRWDTGISRMPESLWAKFLSHLGAEYEPMPLHGRVPVKDAPEAYKAPTALMNALRLHRLEACLTQAELAEKLGIKQSRWASWESGRMRMPERQWYKFLAATDTPKKPYPTDKKSKKAEVYNPGKVKTHAKPIRLDEFALNFHPNEEDMRKVIDYLTKKESPYPDAQPTLNAISVAFCMSGAKFFCEGAKLKIREFEGERARLLEKVDAGKRQVAELKAKIEEYKEFIADAGL